MMMPIEELIARVKQARKELEQLHSLAKLRERRASMQLTTALNNGDLDGAEEASDELKQAHNLMRHCQYDEATLDAVLAYIERQVDIASLINYNT